ncbi:MAG: hypothetical protein JWP52_3529 [Rhizobacter sp.]|nr:hypothetical protein [Rhizobacter sp.]
MNSVWEEMKIAAKETPALYFAPVFWIVRKFESVLMHKPAGARPASRPTPRSADAGAKRSPQQPS